MPYSTISKSGRDLTGVPNLQNYEAARAALTWDQARQELNGLPDGRGLNIAHEAVDRHTAGARSDHLALRWLGKNMEVRNYTYAHLRDLTNRFANVLRKLGVKQGDRVFVLAGRIPELWIAALETFKNRSVFCPLFSAFGPEPIRARMTIGAAKVLVTTETLYQRKVAGIRDALPMLEHVRLVDEDGQPTNVPGTLDFHQLMSEASDEFTIEPTDPEEMALLHFTSGATGKPKGAIHVHQAVIAHHITGKFALDLHPDDIFWCTADPGWVTGTSYGLIAPLTNGVTMIVDEAEFDAERWYSILQNQKVTVWYTAPTAIRMLMKTGAEIARKYDLRALRFAASRSIPKPSSGDRKPSGCRFTTTGGRPKRAASGSPITPRWTSVLARWASRYPALPPPSYRKVKTRRSKSSLNPMCRANWPCVRAGLDVSRLSVRGRTLPQMFR